MGFKTLGVYFLFLVFYYAILGAMDTKVPVIFDIESIIDHNEDAKKQYILSQLRWEDTFSNEFALWSALRRAFGEWFFSSRGARLAFYNFLRGIKLSKKYPSIFFEGDELPPLMAAWVLGDRSTDDTIKSANIYIAEQAYLKKYPGGDVDKVCRKLIPVTFDPEVMAQTCDKRLEAIKLLDNIYSRGFTLYLVGHCNPASYAKFQASEDDAKLLAKFKKVLFSHQIKNLTPATRFDDKWWAQQLGLAYDDSTGYIYIGYGTEDKPPHYYTVSSKALIKILSEAKSAD